MAEMKFEKKEVLPRNEAAARILEVAEALASSGDFELRGSGEKLKLDVADEVTFELEVELEDGKTELEMEIKWSSPEAQVEARPTRSTARRATSRPRKATSRRRR
jgi:amphi-Trp domain-containing protein